MIMLATRRISYLAVAAVLTAQAASAESDCDKAPTAQAKIACEDRELQALKQQVREAYDDLRAQLSPAGGAEVQADQQAWCLDQDSMRG